MNMEKTNIANDLVFYKDQDGKIYGGGYSINSLMLDTDLNVEDGEKFHYVVPNGLMCIPNSNIVQSILDKEDKEAIENIKEHNMLDEGLYEKLLKLASKNPEIRSKTKNNRKSQNKNKKTRRNYL